MRIASLLVLLAGLAACNRGKPSNEVIRQSVVDHLAGRNLNIAMMDIKVAGVQYNGDKADATVVFTPKGGGPVPGMTIHYRMEQKNGRWEVVGTQDSGHATMNPNTPNPHGGGTPEPPTDPQGVMPSPEDLPPAHQK